MKLLIMSSGGDTNRMPQCIVSRNGIENISQVLLFIRASIKVVIITDLGQRQQSA